MGERRGRRGRGIRHALAAAVVAGLMLSPAAGAQDPPQATAPPGGTVTTNVAGVACPWPVVPPGVGYTRTPAECADGVTYAFELSVTPGAALGDHAIPFFDCVGADPPNCSPTATAFVLTVVEAPPTPTPPAGGSLPRPPLRATPETPDEKILNEWVQGLRKAVEDRSLFDAAFEGLPELREGEEHTVTFEVPAELIARVAEDTLGDDRDATQTTIETQLTGDDVTITRRVPAVQDADPGVDARWEWEVEADRSGSADLTLAVTVTSTLRGTPWSKRFFADPKELAVDANWPYKVKTFFGGSWQWLLGLLIPLIAGYLTGRRARPERRRKQAADETTDAPASAG